MVWGLQRPLDVPEGTSLRVSVQSISFEWGESCITGLMSLKGWHGDTTVLISPLRSWGLFNPEGMGVVYPGSCCSDVCSIVYGGGVQHYPHTFDGGPYGQVYVSDQLLDTQEEPYLTGCYTMRAGENEPFASELVFRWEGVPGVQYTRMVIYNKDGQVNDISYPLFSASSGLTVATRATSPLRGVAETVLKPTLDVDIEVEGNVVPPAVAGHYTFDNDNYAGGRKYYTRQIDNPDPYFDRETELIAVSLNRNDGFVLKSWTGNCAYYNANGVYLGMLPESLPEDPEDWITNDTIYVKCLVAQQTQTASAMTDMAVLAGATAEGGIPATVFTGTAAKVVAAVKLLDMKLFGVRFVSDHGVLRDETTDWTVTGEVYDDILPEWCKNQDTGAVQNFPISHTKSTKLDLKTVLECKYDGPAFEGTLYGNRYGDEPAFCFSAACLIQPTGGETAMQIFDNSADGPLVNNIATLGKTIHWEFQVDTDGPVIDLGDSGPHKIYVTYGVPVPPEDCSELRLKTVCEWAVGVTLPRDIADAIGPDATSGFNPIHSSPSRPWEAMVDGADCITLVKLMQSALGLTGVPADKRGDVYYIYAQHLNWDGLRNTGVSQFETKDFSGVEYRLMYKNPSHGTMRWEACLYIDGYDKDSNPSTIKKYWMGGTGIWKEKAVEVLVDRAGAAGSARQYWIRDPNETGPDEIGPVDYPGDPNDCPEPPP